MYALQEELPLMRTSSGLVRSESMRLAKLDTHTSLQTKLRQQLHQRKLAASTAQSLSEVLHNKKSQHKVLHGCMLGQNLLA